VDGRKADKKPRVVVLDPPLPVQARNVKLPAGHGEGLMKGESYKS
jgi:hypothetical protein